MVDKIQKYKLVNSVNPSDIIFESTQINNKLDKCSIKLAKESLILSKLEVKFEKRKKNHDSKYEIDLRTEDDEIQHKLPENKSNFEGFMKFDYDMKTVNNEKSLNSKSKEKKAKRSKKKHIAKSMNYNIETSSKASNSKENTSFIKTNNYVYKQEIIQTENNIGFDHDYKMKKTEKIDNTVSNKKTSQKNIENTKNEVLTVLNRNGKPETKNEKLENKHPLKNRKSSSCISCFSFIK